MAFARARKAKDGGKGPLRATSLPPMAAHKQSQCASRLPDHPSSIAVDAGGTRSTGREPLADCSEAPEAVHETLRSAGFPLESDLRLEMEQRFGRDFGDVRLHADPAAGLAARAVDAIAFAAGNHIVFDRGRYAPETVSGRHLLIHELAHVVQQGSRTPVPGERWRVGSPVSPAESAAEAAARAVDEMPRLHPGLLGSQLAGTENASPVLRRVTTWGGEWSTKRHNTLSTGGQNDGVDIDLHFKPGPPVEATQIAVVQKVTSVRNGATVALNPTVAARSIPAGKPGAGAHIDQDQAARNPLYVANAGGNADKLWDTAEQPGFGKYGFHHVHADGKVDQADATMEDAPQLPGRGPNSSQIFEDTALAVTGQQTGATYGSVQWGWRTDAAGAFTRLPLTKVSDDAPSSSFKAAVDLWNKTPDSTGRDPIKFFTASAQFTQADDSQLVSDPNDAGKTEIGKLPKNSRVEVINKGFWEKFNAASAPVKWWKVTVIEGALIGKTGWMQSTQLGPAKVAEAAVGAP